MFVILIKRTKQIFGVFDSKISATEWCEEQEFSKWEYEVLTIIDVYQLALME